MIENRVVEPQEKAEHALEKIRKGTFLATLMQKLKHSKTCPVCKMYVLLGK